MYYSCPKKLLQLLVLLLASSKFSHGYRVIKEIFFSSYNPSGPGKITQSDWASVIWEVVEWYSGGADSRLTGTYYRGDSITNARYRRTNVCDNYFAIRIRTEDRNYLDLIFFSANLYFVGFRNFAGQVFYFNDWEEPFTPEDLGPTPTMLSVGGSYSALGLANTRFNQNRFYSALSWVGRYARGQTIGDNGRMYLLHVIQFFCEAARFNSVWRSVHDTFENISFNADPRYVSLVTSWASTSRELVRAYEASLLAIPLPTFFEAFGAVGWYYFLSSLLLLQVPRDKPRREIESIPELRSIYSYIGSNWFSEEYGGLSATGPINAIECSGRYCDNKKLWYSSTLNGYLDYTQTITLAPFSEEGTAGRACPPNMLVSRIKCTGSYCDNMALACSPLKSSSIYEIDASSRKTQPFFSDEQDGLSSQYRCPSTYFVNEINCSGRYCDNIRLYCVRVEYKTITRLWPLSYVGSNWFSEEYGGLSATGPINAIECSGRYCDNKKLWYSSTLNGDLDYTQTITLAPFSEEGTAGRACPSNMIVSRIKCTGSYCDKMALSCSPLKTDSNYSIDALSRKTQPFFSDEQDGLSSRYRCPEGYFVNEINCSGRYCDNIQLYCVRVVPKQFIDDLPDVCK